MSSGLDCANGLACLIDWLKLDIPKKNDDFRTKFLNNEFEFCTVELKAIENLESKIGQAFLQALTFATEMGCVYRYLLPQRTLLNEALALIANEASRRIATDGPSLKCAWLKRLS